MCLVQSAVRLVPGQVRLLAVFQARYCPAHRSLALIEFPLALIGSELTLGLRGLVTFGGLLARRGKAI